ncbi:hypothetical protein HHK36_005580 [Tetracentron sinense]|uniref:Peroxidase n=1 Tax=Tetracentron sinense TaxID=13715 RepID=A0A835DQT6_TETSI|nr:hypothetical protein HHK36_005580 [Tetracentron sinense]
MMAMATMTTTRKATATAMATEMRSVTEMWSATAMENYLRSILSVRMVDPEKSSGFLGFIDFDFWKLILLQGCDASVLLDSKGDNVAEKEASLNLSPRGFEVIDEIKMELEKQCRGVVSCADILALATRDGVALSGGSSYHIPTGGRDGMISTIGEVQIPGPSFSVDAALSALQTINLDLDDLTTLLGAHNIGFCHCGFFVNRLYNFEGTGLPDPDLDPGLLDSLQKKCPIPINQIFNISIDPTVFMTPMTKTPFTLDSSFYCGCLTGKRFFSWIKNLPSLMLLVHWH